MYSIAFQPADSPMSGLSLLIIIIHLFSLILPHCKGKLSAASSFKPEYESKQQKMQTDKLDHGCQQINSA